MAAYVTRVEARLRMIEEEGHMDTEDVVLKQVAAARVAELSALAASYEGEDIGPVIGPLYEEMWRRVCVAGVRPAGAPIAYYVAVPGATGDGQVVMVHAAVEVARDTNADWDFDVLDLPGIESAATIVHRGPMDEADRSAVRRSRGSAVIAFDGDACLVE